MLKTLFTTVSMLMISVGVASAQYRGVAAADGNNYVSTAYSQTKLEAEQLAREDCREVTRGRACKAISAGSENVFAVVRCGMFVHMAAEATASEARETAAANARSFGHGGCRVIFLSY